MQGCGRFFSVKAGPFFEASNFGHQSWLFALFVVATNLKGVSSTKLRGDISVSQRTAWQMAYRNRKVLSLGDGNLFDLGGKRRNMCNSKPTEVAGCEPVAKSAVGGTRDCETDKDAAKVVSGTTRETFQVFVRGQTIPVTTTSADESTVDATVPNRDAVQRSVSEYVRGRVHISGVQGFWSTLKWAHEATFHGLPPNFLHRDIDEFAGHRNVRDPGTLLQVDSAIARIEASQLRYEDIGGGSGPRSGTKAA